MKAGKRRRRIERIKMFIRCLFFLKKHMGQVIIASVLCLIFATAYFSIHTAKAAEEKENGSMNSVQIVQAAKSEQKPPDSTSTEKTEKIYEGEELEEEDTFPQSSGEETELEQKYATSHKTEEPVCPADIYSEKDSIAVFKCFYPEASGYTWEIFNEDIQEWVKAPASDITKQTDELQRDVSSFLAIASKENDGLTVRCITDFPDKESATDTAVLHILDKSIAGISVENYVAESGQYLNAREIPLIVTYQDGSEETITGLNGVYFFDTEMTSEESTSVSGNMIETVTTIIESHEYTLLDTGEKEASIRYKNAEQSIDIPVKLIGEDKTPPVISKFIVSDFEISNVDKPVAATITIEASDDTTQEQNLLYALLPEGKEPEDEDWKESPNFTAEITQNGIWTAYCKDEGGNITTEQKEIIAVDNKAPYVSLQLKNPDSWCQTNTIMVKATDALPVEYRYICVDSGADSGWVGRSRYDVDENGVWTVQAKDAAGNIAETEITVSNIDKQPPVIQEIKVVKAEKEGERAINEN